MINQLRLINFDFIENGIKFDIDMAFDYQSQNWLAGTFNPSNSENNKFVERNETSYLINNNNIIESDITATLYYRKDEIKHKNFNIFGREKCIFVYEDDYQTYYCHVIYDNHNATILNSYDGYQVYTITFIKYSNWFTISTMNLTKGYLLGGYDYNYEVPYLGLSYISKEETRTIPQNFNQTFDFPFTDKVTTKTDVDPYVHIIGHKPAPYRLVCELARIKDEELRLKIGKVVNLKFDLKNKQGDYFILDTRVDKTECVIYNSDTGKKTTIFSTSFKDNIFKQIPFGHHLLELNIIGDIELKYFNQYTII